MAMQWQKKSGKVMNFAAPMTGGCFLCFGGRSCFIATREKQGW